MELQVRKHKYLQQKIEKMFELPLMISICMLAMAHGANEINVPAPLTAEIFLLDADDSSIRTYQQFIAIIIGLASVLTGTLLLGSRLLYKQKTRFMKTKISNGVIANTVTSLILFMSTVMN
jgi:phosphate/sulfate permease